MIIGLTGTKASGKGKFADILKEKGFVYISLSDIVREEATRRGILDYTIVQLQDIGNELREKHGAGVLAKMAISKFSEGENYVIDGIRNPGEIGEFGRYGDFKLIAVDAQPEIRFRRILARRRHSDPKNWEEFLAMERRDLGLDELSEGQQVLKCMELANIKVYNHGSIDELMDRIIQILGC
jgi:dephospho-CoA kinase